MYIYLANTVFDHLHMTVCIVDIIQFSKKTGKENWFLRNDRYSSSLTEMREGINMNREFKTR